MEGTRINMKNYYEILEVDKNASKEIIDKAYRTLVKKYHPDLKEQNEKNQAETKIKEINEAYDILSDELKRSEYNKTLKDNYISMEEYNLLIYENKKLKNELNTIKSTIYQYQNNNYYNTYQKYNNSTQSKNQNQYYTSNYQNQSNNKYSDTYQNNIQKNNSKNNNYFFDFISTVIKTLFSIFFDFFGFVFIILIALILLRFLFI